MTYYSRMFKPQTLVSCLLGKCLYKGTFQRPTALLLHQNSCLPSTHYIPFEDLSFWSTQFFCLAGNSLSKSSKLRFTGYQSQPRYRTRLPAAGADSGRTATQPLSRDRYIAGDFVPLDLGTRADLRQCVQWKPHRPDGLFIWRKPLR